MDQSQSASFHAGRAKGQTQEKASDIMGKASNTAQCAKSSFEETGQQMKVKAQDAADAVKSTVGAHK